MTVGTYLTVRCVNLEKANPPVFSKTNSATTTMTAKPVNAVYLANAFLISALGFSGNPDLMFLTILMETAVRAAPSNMYSKI